MSKKTMLINVTHVEESRVAILQDGVLESYEIETSNRTAIKGNIYNSVVESVHPALDAAFVRISSDLKGFLPIDEVNFKLLPQRRDDRAQGRIGQHLHAGQKLITQVVREPFSGKPPTVSTYFSLPGRHLVLMPGVDTGGISRKIEDSDQRERLKKIIGELKLPDGFGVIVRTAGIGQTKTELNRDLRYLLRLWESIQKGSSQTEFPGIVYRERDLVIRTIRDHYTQEIGEVWIDHPEMHARALEFVRDVMPTRSKAVRLYTGDRPLFNKYNLEEQIERIYKRRVPLPSGGEIVIDGTEALTAIDVNSARSSRKADAEDNATRTNLEAAVEIARQLRLRDLGGLVVIDFIDMAASRNVKKVEKALRDAMKGDRARYDATRISKLGLMELSRQRLKGAKLASSYATCPSCEGYGLVKNVEASGLAAVRKLQTRATRGGIGRIDLTVPADVASWILNQKREELRQIERRNDVRLVVEGDTTMLRHESRFDTHSKTDTAPADGAPTPAELAAAESAERASRSGRRSSDRKTPPADAKETAEEPVTPPDDAGEEAPAEEAASAPRRRRRRRRGSRSSETNAATESAATPPEPAASAADPAPDAPDASDAPDAEENGAEGTKPRRRRRRRRSRSSSKTADAESATETSENVDSPRAVPSSVRSDELMPAASGGGKSGRSRGRRGRGRRDSAES